LNKLHPITLVFTDGTVVDVRGRFLAKLVVQALKFFLKMGDMILESEKSSAM
jgi:hypothetical protein